MGCLSRGLVEQQKLPQQSSQEAFCCCAWEMWLRQQCVGSAGKGGCFSLDVAGAVMQLLLCVWHWGQSGTLTQTEQPWHLSLPFQSFLSLSSCSAPTLLCSRAESAVQVQCYSHVLQLSSWSANVATAALMHKTLCFIYCKACSEESKPEKWRRHRAVKWPEDTESSVKKFVLTVSLP